MARLTTFKIRSCCIRLFSFCNLTELLISPLKAIKQLRMLLMSFSLLTFMKNVQHNHCNVSLFSPQAQDLSGRKRTLVLGDKL